MSEKLFKPMLAGKVDDFDKLRFPMLASVKLDGIRATIHSAAGRGGVAMSRSMKPLPNMFLQNWVRDNALWLNGLDGEVIVGDPNLPTTYNTTVSAVMCENRSAPFTFYVFDKWDLPAYSESGAKWDFAARLDFAAHKVRQIGGEQVRILPHIMLHSIADLNAFEEKALDQGYEGVMLRDPQGGYKNGRSSFKEHILLKVKRYEDAEATIIGFEEEQHNGNERFTNELGRGARSSHQENKTGKGSLGAFVVSGLTAYPGITFNVGTGYTADERARFWNARDAMIGKVITFKHFPIGAKDAPRHPVFKGFRDQMDMELAA